MLGSRIRYDVSDDISVVNSHMTAFKLCELGLHQAFTEGTAAGDAHVALMGYVQLLPGARGVVGLAKICLGNRKAVNPKLEGMPHVLEAQELLSNLLPVAVWHAVARSIALGASSPRYESASSHALAKDFRPRLHRIIRCAAVADPDAAVRIMIDTAALAVGWIERLWQQGGSTALMAGVAGLAIDLDSLNVLDSIELGEQGICRVEPILFSQRRQWDVMDCDGMGIATKEQAALRDLAACARHHAGQIQALRELLPSERYTYARSVLHQGREHSRELSRSARARREWHGYSVSMKTKARSHLRVVSGGSKV